MPLYDQSTNLAAQGKFAPGVNYRADVRKPTQPMPDFPKGQYQFNIDLNSIGKALANMSRDQASVEETKFKLEYAQKEKADAAAEKQLKTDTSNALAQEIAAVTAQLDQGIINPLTASRMQREIKDRYRAMGVLDAATIAATANAEDGGASTFLQNRREQYGKAEVAENTKILSEIHDKVPSSRNMSNPEAINLWHQVRQAGIKAAAGVVNYNSTSGTGEAGELSYRTLMNDGLDAAVYQAATTLSNATSSNSNMSPSQMMQNAYENTFRYFKGIGASDEVSMAMANSAMTELKPYTSMIQDGTKDEKEFWENLALSGKYQRQVMFHKAFPVEAWAAENPGTNFSNYGVQYTDLGEGGKMGAVILPTPTTNTAGMYAQTSNGFAAQQVPVSYTFPNGVTYPINNETAYVANHGRDYLTALATGKMPIGSFIGRNVSMGTLVTAAYNPNMNLTGGEIIGTSSSDLQTAVNNGKAFYGAINSATGQSNLKKQGEFDGVDYINTMNSYDTTKGMEIWSKDHEKWNNVYNEHGRKIQDSNYLKKFLRIAPDGSLMMTPTKGYLNGFVDFVTGEDFKKHVIAINEETQGFDPLSRASLSRALVSKKGEGIPNADPNIDTYLSNDITLKEAAGNAAVKSFKWINKQVNEKIVPAEEKYVDTIEKEVMNPLLQNFDEWYKNTAEPYIKKTVEEKGYNIRQSYLKYLEDNNLEDNASSRQEFLLASSYSILQDLGKKIKEYAKEKAKKYDEKFTDTEQESEFTLPEPTVGGIEGVLQSDFEKEIDLQKGTIDFTDPNALPIVVLDDGKSWASIKFATISDNGRTYVVPTITETGEPSTAEAEFEKGRTLLSVKGTGKKDIDRAEYFGQKVRQYLIDRDTPKAEARMAEVRNMSSISGGGVQEIVGKIKNSKNISEPKKKSLLEKIVEVNDAFGEGAFEGMEAFFEGWGEEMEDNILPIGKMLAYNAIAEEYGYIDAQQMLEDTDTGLRGQIMIPATMIPTRTAYKVIDWIANDAPDIKPITWLKKLFKNDEGKILDAAASVFVGGDASKREKEKFIKSYKTWKEQNLEADTAYYQNFSGIN
jgi:hypothetical protein